MFAKFHAYSRYLLLLFAFNTSALCIHTSTAFAATGSFAAVLNEISGFGDSMRSVEFFDAADMSTPLFSVFIGYEVPGNFEELSAISVDPGSGDIYVISFDSGDTGVPDSVGDTQGDMDLYRFPFATIYDHWSANFQGHDVRGEALVGGAAPSGTNNMNNLDYVTYGTDTFDQFHSNTFVLSGAVEKIGQVNRGNGGSFFPFALDFVDSDTLLLLDDSIGDQTTNDPLDDHSVRIIEKISASPGLATSTMVTRTGGGSNYNNGGFNGGGTLESWESKIIESAGAPVDDPFLLALDGAGHAEPESMAYYHDSSTGVRGVWITESDSGPGTPGDAVAFLELDANGESIGYRPQVGGGSPFTLSLSNDPASGEDLMGKADNIFVDRDTGDLIIVESGFADSSDGVGPDHEPGVLRVPVNYDNGFGEIEFGTWQTKLILDPTKDPGDTFLERGSWTAYDDVSDIMYFFAPGGGGETPEFEMDIHALDLSTGITTSFMNVDDSINLFFGDSFGDKAVAFTLAAPGGIDGDYNGDDKVDAADYVIWRKNEGTMNTLPNDPHGGTIGQAQYDTWVANFGGMAPGSGGGSAGVVPEPASAALLLIGLAAFISRRRVA